MFLDCLILKCEVLLSSGISFTLYQSTRCNVLVGSLAVRSSNVAGETLLVLRWQHTRNAVPLSAKLPRALALTAFDPASWPTRHLDPVRSPTLKIQFKYFVFFDEIRYWIRRRLVEKTVCLRPHTEGAGRVQVCGVFVSKICTLCSQHRSVRKCYLA